MKVRTVRRPAGKAGRQEAVEDSAENATAAADGVPRAGERITYRCPFCDGDANATYKATKHGDYEWFIGCWSLDCEGRHLPSLSDALGLGEGADKERIVVALRGVGRSGRRREAKPPPSLASVEGWHTRLMGPDGRAALAYLDGRGVSLDAIEAARIGWDGRALTFPMFDTLGELGAFKTRVPKPGMQMRALPGEGRAWPLYPVVSRRKGWTLLLAGEFDALAARSVGLPAVSVTLGAGHWRDDWTADLAGLRVVVCFDNNEVEQAVERVVALRAAGLDAYRLDLPSVGLDAPKGDLSDYLNGGGDPAQLLPRRHVVRARRA